MIGKDDVRRYTSSIISYKIQDRTSSSSILTRTTPTLLRFLILLLQKQSHMPWKKEDRILGVPENEFQPSNEIARNFRGIREQVETHVEPNRFAAPSMSINNDCYIDVERPLFLIVRRKCSPWTSEFLLFPWLHDCIQMQIRSLPAVCSAEHGIIIARSITVSLLMPVFHRCACWFVPSSCLSCHFWYVLRMVEKRKSRDQETRNWMFRSLVVCYSRQGSRYCQFTILCRIIIRD